MLSKAARQDPEAMDHALLDPSTAATAVKKTGSGKAAKHTGDYESSERRATEEDLFDKYFPSAWKAQA